MATGSLSDQREAERTAADKKSQRKRLSFRLFANAFTGRTIIARIPFPNPRRSTWSTMGTIQALAGTGAAGQDIRFLVLACG